MNEMQIRNAEEIDLSAAAPPTAVSVKLQVSVEPIGSAVLIYSPASLDPVRFNAPGEIKDVPISGPTIYVQKIQGAGSYRVEPVGYEDDIG